MFNLQHRLYMKQSEGLFNENVLTEKKNIFSEFYTPIELL